MPADQLFPITRRLPEGFLYKDNFLTPDEERRLIEQVRLVAVKPMIFQGFEARRKVASFGYDYSFDKRQLTRGKEIPDDFKWVVEKVAAELSLASSAFAELLITEYPVGSVINWHRDAPPFELIAGISLLSDCLFKLRPHAKEKQSRKATISFPVGRRSLYVISGPSRSEWQHSVAPVEKARYSVTLRTLREIRDE